MSQQLIYTSAPRGLKPGSRGYCTVATTPGMPANLADRLEALSGYRHVVAPGDPRNPVNYSFLSFVLGGRRCYVLSRVADAGLDYTQRTNKLAHHLVLDQNELPTGGPAILLTHSSLFETMWAGEPRTIAPKAVPRVVVTPGRCERWEQITGDAGWGGYLAAGNGRSSVPITIVYEPGVPVLDLLGESMALLPEEQRWQTTFSTYFNKLPPGIECQWRCVLEESAEAQQAARVPGAVIIDLVKLSSAPQRAPDGPLVEAARTGDISRAGAMVNSTSGRALTLADEELERELGLVDVPEDMALQQRPSDARMVKQLTHLSDHAMAVRPPSPATQGSEALHLARFRTKSKKVWLYACVATVFLMVASVGGTIAFLYASGVFSLPHASDDEAALADNQRDQTSNKDEARLEAAQKELADQKAQDERIAQERQRENEQKKAKDELATAQAERKEITKKDAEEKRKSDEDIQRQGEAEKRKQEQDQRVKDFQEALKSTRPVILPSLPEAPSLRNREGRPQSKAILVPGDWKTVASTFRLQLIGSGPQNTIQNGSHLTFRAVNSYEYECGAVQPVLGGKRRYPVAKFTLGPDGLWFEWVRDYIIKDASARSTAAFLRNCILSVRSAENKIVRDIPLRQAIALEPYKIDIRADRGSFTQNIEGVPENFRLEFHIRGIPGVRDDLNVTSNPVVVDDRVALRVKMEDNRLVYELQDIANVLGNSSTGGVSQPQIETRLANLERSFQKRLQQKVDAEKNRFRPLWNEARTEAQRESVKRELQKALEEVEAKLTAEVDSNKNRLLELKQTLESKVANGVIYARLYVTVHAAGTDSIPKKVYQIEVARTRTAFGENVE